MNKRAILLGPCIGSWKNLTRLLRRARIRSSDLLVGVDGGTGYWVKNRFQPDFAVGDWDSLRNRKDVLSQIPHVSLPTDKNRSDLFFSILAAVEAGADEILCMGVTGGRMDHHLAVLMDLSEFADGRYGKLKSVQAWGEDGDYIFLSKGIPVWRLMTARGQLVSFFAMNREVDGVTLTGFRYPLKNTRLVPSSWGLSNRAEKRKCEVRLRKGKLLVIMPRNGCS